MAKKDCVLEHEARINKYGVSWCIECGKLMPNDAKKPLDKIKINGVFVPIKSKQL